MATVTRTTVWSDGQALTAAALNGEFNNSLNALALTNADIASNAAIATSKINFGGTNGQYLQSNGSGGVNYTTLGRGYGFFAGGTQAVANDLSWNPTAPAAQTATYLAAHAKTAPTGAGLTVRIFNVTQGVAVASVTIAAGTTDITTTSMTTAAINANDVLRMDITAIGSTIAGSDISATLNVTQP